MKNIAYIISLLFCTLFISCDNEDEERVFKQYLHSHLVDAQTIADEATEGTAEGEYRKGSKDELQSVIEEGFSVYWNKKSSQRQVDEYCNKLAEALLLFEDKMYPYFSEMEALLEQSRRVLNNTEVGNGEGLIPSQEDKSSLHSAISEAENALSAIPQNEMTQRALDVIRQALITELFAFEGKIPGRVDIYVENPSFEPNGSGSHIIDDFNLIPGWENVGYLDNFSPWEGLVGNSIIKNDDWELKDRLNLDGSYALYVMNYGKQVWQLLGEGLHPSCHYTIKVNASMYNWLDADNVKLLVQLVVFNGKSGDFNKAVVLKSEEFNRISTSDFKEYSLVYASPLTSEYIGKQMVVCFRAYFDTVAEAADGEGFEWNDSGVFVDNVRIIREASKQQ